MVRYDMIRLYYFIKALVTTNWHDIGINTPFENHAINVSGHLVEFAPLDLILDIQETLQLILFLGIFGGVFIYNFMLGYRGK